MTPSSAAPQPHVRWFAELGSGDVASVGGKNASLGELLGQLAGLGVRVTDGYSTTAGAFRELIAELTPAIAGQLEALAAGRPLDQVGPAIRALIEGAPVPPAIESAIREAYRELVRRSGTDAVAVRSSATAEDLPDASFAGQQESYLNVRGEDALLAACRRCWASLFTDRAISYREARGFDHMKVALAIGVQPMVRSDIGASGVMFTLHTETGFPRLIVINAAWGLGETVVRGTVDPDETLVFKPLLEREGVVPIVDRVRGAKRHKMIYADEAGAPTRTVETSQAEQLALVLDDEEVLQLARWGVAIERHYGRPMDIEWARDGATGELVILQARPETVEARRGSASLRTYALTAPAEARGEVRVEGLAIGSAIASGAVARLDRLDQADQFVDGQILVTEMTEPDWVPVMRRAAGVITDRGGRTCHAAIVSRELGIPALVGTGDATATLRDGQRITMTCAEGDRGLVYDGELAFETHEVDLRDVPSTRTRVMLNIGSADAALAWWRLPADGIGLARLEFIIDHDVRVHPMAVLRFDQLEDEAARARIRELTAGYDDRSEYVVARLAAGIARIAASQHPRPVIVRTSDFKTNEYANLVGGRPFEPSEDNPMIGWRGASRYYHPDYREAFGLECRALDRVRRLIGLDNVVVMIPFCRTTGEADRVLEVMAEHGLRRGEAGLRVYMMCEVPSNVILAEQFASRFDGFSIGSNDLTQLTLGIDRDSAELQTLFDERDPAVVEMIRRAIAAAKASGIPVGICGQAPSDHAEFAELLVDAGIDSISVNPDSVVDVKRRVAALEQRA